VPLLILKALKRVRKTAKGCSRGEADRPGDPKPFTGGAPAGAPPPEHDVFAGEAYAGGHPLAGVFHPSILHKLRIALKGLRYTCEFFLPVLGKDIREDVKTIVAFQDCLGRYQDAVTATRLLKDLPGKTAVNEHAPDEETLLAFGALIQVQREAALSEMEKYSKLWKSFKKIDKKLRRLLHDFSEPSTQPQ
jgi:hypothetical protein